MSFSSIRGHFLTKGIQQDIVDTLLEEYSKMKKAAFKRDVVPSLLHSAKFADLALAFVINYLDKTYIDIDKIQTGTFMQDLISRPKTTPEEVILSLALPRTVSSIHTVRNKKDVAHVKSIDPDDFDIGLCETSCDWILSQLVCLIHGGTQADVKLIISQLCQRKMPWIQEFDDGSLMLLVTEIPLRDQALLVLYYHDPKQMNALEISEILQYQNFSYLRNLLDELSVPRLVQKRTQNFVYVYRITDKGAKEAERLLEEIRLS